MFVQALFDQLSRHLSNDIYSTSFENITHHEIELLIYGYVREQRKEPLHKVIQIIRNKFEVLETFDCNRQRKINLTEKISTDRNNKLNRIECFVENGYDENVHYLSMKIDKRTKNNYCLELGVLSPMSFDKYGISASNGIFTIKLDCDNNKVIFYKDFKYKLSESETSKDNAYQFYVRYCENQTASIEIIKTDVDMIKKNTNQQMLILRDDELRKISLKLVTANNNEFIEFSNKMLKSKLSEKLWDKGDRDSSGQIETEEFKSFFVLPVTLYKIAVYQRNNNTKEKPKLNDAKVRKDFLHLTTWIMIKYGKLQNDGHYEFTLDKENFADKIVGYLKTYADCKGKLLVDE